MSLTVSSKFNRPNAISFKRSENVISSDSSSMNYMDSETKKSKGLKGAAAGVAYTWVNIAEVAKGVVKGLFYGFLTGTVIAGANILRYGGKKVKSGEIKPIQRLSRKAITKSGKVWSWIVAGGVFLGNLALARLRANKRTANVDHMLYEGHRN